jgi:hypothetical protein
MNEIGKKRTIKLYSNNLNSGGVQYLQPVYWDTLTKQHIRITKSGEIILQRNFDTTAGEEGMIISLDKKRTLPNDEGSQQFLLFEVQEKPFPPEWDDSMIAMNNANVGLERFLKKHPEVSVKAGDGTELNPNCRQSRYIIEDDLAIAQETYERTQKVTNAKLELSNIFKDEDKGLFEDLCYGLGLGNLVKTYDPKQLFNVVATICEKNPDSFIGFVFSPEREMNVILQRASTPGPNGEMSDIVMNNGFYFINGEIIAKSFDELKMYFRGHQEEFKYFVDKYGRSKEAAKPSALKKGVNK